MIKLVVEKYAVVWVYSCVNVIASNQSIDEDIMNNGKYIGKNL